MLMSEKTPLFRGFLAHFSSDYCQSPDFSNGTRKKQWIIFAKKVENSQFRRGGCQKCTDNFVQCAQDKFTLPAEALSEGEKRLLPFYGKHVFLCDD